MTLEVGSLHQPGEVGDQLPVIAVGFDDGRVDVFSFSKVWLSNPLTLEGEMGELVGVVGRAPSASPSEDGPTGVTPAPPRLKDGPVKSSMVRNSVITEGEEERQEGDDLE